MKEATIPHLSFQESTCFQLNVIKEKDERNKKYIFAEAPAEFDNKSVLVDNEKKAYIHLTSSMLSAESVKLDKSVKLFRNSWHHKEHMGKPKSFFKHCKALPTLSKQRVFVEVIYNLMWNKKSHAIGEN